LNVALLRVKGNSCRNGSRAPSTLFSNGTQVKSAESFGTLASHWSVAQVDDDDGGGKSDILLLDSPGSAQNFDNPTRGAPAPPPSSASLAPIVPAILRCG
jgi:hypothetical protein